MNTKSKDKNPAHSGLNEGGRYAVGYLRVSTSEQTVENQRIAINAYAELHGFTVLDFFEDPATSGRIPPMQRKGFTEMIKFLHEEPISAVFVYDLSRVGRTCYEALEAIKMVDSVSVLIPVSTKESFLQTSEQSIRKLLIMILTWVAEREKDSISQRTKDGLVRAAAEGKQIGRPEKSIDKGVLITCLVQGLPKGNIAKKLGVSRATLYKFIHELEREGVYRNGTVAIKNTVGYDYS